jgi:hypothetical protein
MADWLVARFVAAFTGADIKTHEIAAAANNGAFKRLLNRFPLHATLLPAKISRNLFVAGACRAEVNDLLTILQVSLIDFGEIPDQIG